MEIGMVKKIDIDHEMQQSYLDYAMSVIVARALPDARDGLKPVQRRILYAMNEMNLGSGSDYKKSARIVGEVLGKFHPHGDMAVYEAMARLAQDFTMRACLIDGQGNFGSVDGDPPAAMRYTEARLTPIAMEILSTIDQNTVDFTRNFDDTLNEPTVLPAGIPNLLVNGASGIAVGMATNIPPHNLGEVIDALGFMLERWDKLDDVGVSELMRFIQGPDFPTGGIIIKQGEVDDLQSAYGSGKGKIVVRGLARVEEMSRGRSRIIISEIPYQVNKASLIERIAELVRDGGLEGIADLRDESDRQGMRIVIEVNKASDTDQVLRELYRRTPLESTIGINILALVGGEPRLLTLKQALRVFLEHRQEVVRRRSEFALKRAQDRAHILEGLRTALKNLDEVITLIRNAPDVDTARQRLMKRFTLTQIQAQAILDMPLRRLASLERKLIDQEYKELTMKIKELQALLKSPGKIRQVIHDELTLIKQTYNDRRRTRIISLREGESATSLLTTTDLTPAQVVWVGITEDHRIARTSGDDLPRVSGKEAPSWLLRTNTHHTLYLLAKNGDCAAVAIHALPEVAKFSDGTTLSKVSPLPEEVEIAGIFSLPALESLVDERCVMTVSRLGMVKKTSITELPKPSAQKFCLVKVNPGDEVRCALLTSGNNEIILATSGGMVIRFSEQEVRPMGLFAAGVVGIKLNEIDEVCGADVFSESADLVMISRSGKGWRIPLSEFNLQGRGGLGNPSVKLVAPDRLVAALLMRRGKNALLCFQKAAAKTFSFNDLESGRRLASPQTVAELRVGDSIIRMTPLRDGLEFWEEKLKPTRKRKSGVK